LLVVKQLMPQKAALFHRDGEKCGLSGFAAADFRQDVSSGRSG
jgi:hypothetical protein